MKLLIKKLDDILDNSISLTERGILITIMLVKEKDPKMTLAKCKTKISFIKNKVELISLHKKGLISWSGYEGAVASLKKKEENPVILEILDFMNSLYRRNFGPTLERCTKITKLLDSKITVEEIKSVIANRYSVWKDDSVMYIHLVPETVFRYSKFIKYLDEVKHTGEGGSFVSVDKINLKNGQEITPEIAEHFSDNDLFTIMTFELDHDGQKITRGREIVKSGKDIKRLLKVREGQDWKEFKLTYVQK